MIENYEIKKINNIEVLCLYVDITNEFASIKDNIKLKRFIKDFIKNNKIAFTGTLVALVIGGKLICNFDLKENKLIPVADENSVQIQEHPEIFNNYDNEIVIQNNENQNSFLELVPQEEKDYKIENLSSIVSNVIDKKDKTKDSYTISPTETLEVEEEIVDNNIYVNIKRNNDIIKIELEDYLVGVVGAEMPASFESEALKAQAIIARTYTLKAISTGKTLTDNNSTQNYKNNDELKSLWGNDYKKYYNKIKNAVNETNGMYLSYGGDYIEAVYHSTSNGMTEDAVNVWGNFFPYLVSVSSEYDSINPSFNMEKYLSYEEISSKLGITISLETEFNTLEKTESGRIKTLEVNGKVYKSTDFRNILGLRSTDFEIIKNEKGITFITKGYGHGVGLSQYGANGMAKNGFDYIQILSHYYPGTTLNHI